MLFKAPSREFYAGLSPDDRFVGVDEAGRGPLAGPVVAAAVMLCKNPPEGIGDSKKLTARKRGLLEPQIQQSCAWGLAIVQPEAIDRLNIFAATMLAMTIAVDNLTKAIGAEPTIALIDGNLTPEGRVAEWRWPARAIVGGDAIEPAISAASILAKEYRDRIMVEAAKAYPHYAWEKNKGYGTKAHMEGLREFGPTPLHRRSFAPVAQLEMAFPSKK